MADPRLESNRRRARLSLEDAAEIRVLYATGDLSQAEIAERFDVSQVMVSRIVRNLNWVEDASVDPKYREPWHVRNRERIRQQHQEQAAADPDYWRKRHFKRRYGLTLVQLELMLKEQDGRCASCGDEIELGRMTHLDHCHRSGAIRGLLCQYCNQALGLLKDDPIRIEALKRYAESFGF